MHVMILIVEDETMEVAFLINSCDITLMLASIFISASKPVLGREQHYASYKCTPYKEETNSE